MERFKFFNNELDSLIKRLNELKTEIDSLSKEESEIMSRIKDISTEEYLNIYEGNGFISSVILETENSELEFVPKDQYIKIDEAKSNELRSVYGDITYVSYAADSTIVNKHIDTIKDAIDGTIPQKDFDKLFKESYNIKKGTIKEMERYTSDIKTLYKDIQVVSSLKNIKTK